MKVSIIIPNFNGERLLRKNLPVVLQIEGVDEIVIVDDGSTDGSVKTIKNEKLKIKNDLPRGKAGNVKFKIIENKKNLGFSSTVNVGVKNATGEIVVLFNTDVVPQPDFLKPLVTHFEDPQVFAVGCLDKSIENGTTVLRGRGVGRWERGFLIHQRGEVDKTDTFWVSGGSGAFRKSIWQKLGGLDELYNPFYWEDIDLSYRAQKAGYKILFEKESIVVHRHQEGAIRQKYTTNQVKTIAYRNQFIFIWKNITDWDKRLSHLFWLPYHFGKAILNGDWVFLAGFLGAFGQAPKIIRSAFNNRKMLIKKDKEIIN